ncbi:2-nitropropane dioxygenase [Pelobium manganitolerans]|uniref:2-nitropropane dioxygenase n=1 Tax=Pelobium manganitolerans TaxID=1842495 RepID=A0A419S1J1_9SPHI|nr:nitronate monooxygenase [Pelobium manganitolerans]RKD12350.1 2-nitropropane dioxygenase [Pelobium manganitolerans]
MNKICKLFKIKYPIIQAGMVWCSGWELASAVSNAGGLGILGAASMYPDVLRQHIQKLKTVCSKPFAVNLALLYPDIEAHIQIIIQEKVPIVFTSAGNPMLWTQKLKEAGIVVVHVIANTKFALKALDAGVDALVAEGFEAGGHNGKEETTTLCLVPKIVDLVDIPVIAAGGISSGKSMLAAFALGADAVQVGSRFAASVESSAHPNFKQAIIQSREGDTKLSLKKLTPVRLLHNTFAQQVHEAERRGADKEELALLLGRGRAKAGMFLGDLETGELEIGQVAANFDEILPAATIVEQMMSEFLAEKQRLQEINF